jgi:hypothetical protein
MLNPDNVAGQLSFGRITILTELSLITDKLA